MPVPDVNCIGVWKIQFTISVIVTPDGIIRSDGVLIRCAMEPGQESISIDNSCINSDQPFKASSALALGVISCMSGAIWCGQLWQESIHGPCNEYNVWSAAIWFWQWAYQFHTIFYTPWSALMDRHTHSVSVACKILYTMISFGGQAYTVRTGI